MITPKKFTKIFFIKKKREIAKIRPAVCKFIPSKKLKAFIKSK